MEDLPFETVRLTADDVRALEATYDALKKDYHASLPCDVDLPLNKFDLFVNNPDLNVGGILSIAHPTSNCYMAFIRVHIYSNSIRGGEPIDYYRYQLWGYIKSKKDYGRVLIRRETFADKIAGLIHPVELKFTDDNAFTHKYYVVTNDSDKALLAMSWNFRNVIMGFEDERTVIETADDMLIIGNNRWVDKDDAVYLADIVTKLASVS